MPRHDWFRDDTMTDDHRQERGFFGDRSRDDSRRERRPFFDRDRERGSRGSDRDRSSGGWGGLMGDEDRREYSDRERRDDGRDRDWGRDERRRERGRDYRDQYGSDNDSEQIPTDETKRLIASNKVEGTPVYDRRGERLGSIYNFMVDKYEGEVVYAVLRHGGFLGLGDRYFPLDWDDLDYDTRLGGYRVSFEEEDLERFESYDSEGRRHGGRERSRSSGGWSDDDSDRGRNRDRDRGNRYTPW